MKPRDPLPKELFYRAQRDGENYTRPHDSARAAFDPSDLAVSGEPTVVGRYALVEEMEVRNVTTLDVKSLTPRTGKKAK